jgi:chromosome segregation ATPase
MVGRDYAPAEVIFCEELPVRLRYPDKESYVASVLCKVSLEPGASPVLCVQLTSPEEDPYFLYALRVLDADFHVLKNEQSLLVDFQTFPTMLATLLQECRAGGKYAGQFSVGAEGTLSLIETNGFRELTHLFLKFRKGNDDAIKEHLAGRISVLSSDLTKVHDRSRDQDKENVLLRNERDQLSASVRQLTQEQQQAIRAAELRADATIAELREAHGRELREIGITSQRERMEAETRLQESLRSAEGRAVKAEASLDEHLKTVEDLQAQLTTTTRQYDTTKAALRETEVQLEERRGKAQQNERERFELEKKVAGLTVQCSSYAEQIKAKEAALTTAAEMKQAGLSQKESTEEHLQVTKGQLQTSEDKLAIAVKEIDRGNSIIHTLQSQVKNLKGKLRLQTTALHEQEKTVLELEKGIDATRKDADQERKERVAADDRKQDANRQAEECQKKLQEAQELLASNKQVIDFLNKQLTDRELSFGLGGTAPADFSLGTGLTTGGASRRLMTDGYLAALRGDRMKGFEPILGIGDALYGKTPPSPSAIRATPGPLSSAPSVLGPASPGVLSPFLETTTSATPTPLRDQGPIHYVRPTA